MMQFLPRLDRSTLTVLFFAALTRIACGHPGHGFAPDGSGPEHYLLSPGHWGVAVLLGLLAVAGMLVLRGRRRTSAA